MRGREDELLQLSTDCRGISASYLIIGQYMLSETAAYLSARVFQSVGTSCVMKKWSCFVGVATELSFVPSPPALDH
jgi:hypothetical protein